MDLDQHHPKTICIHRVLWYWCGQNPRGFKRILTTTTRKPKTFIAFRGGGGQNSYELMLILPTTSTKPHGFTTSGFGVIVADHDQKKTQRFHRMLWSKSQRMQWKSDHHRHRVPRNHQFFSFVAWDPRPHPFTYIENTITT